VVVEVPLIGSVSRGEGAVVEADVAVALVTFRAKGHNDFVAQNLEKPSR
jgi:hypothetical protein